MNNYSRAELAALWAIDLRYMVEEAARCGFLRGGVRRDLESVADDVVIDAQLGIDYPSEPPRPPGEHPSK